MARKNPEQILGVPEARYELNQRIIFGKPVYLICAIHRNRKKGIIEYMIWTDFTIDLL